MNLSVKHLEIYSDGGSRGNPGPAAIGYVAYANQELLYQGSLYIGSATNNIAEYLAIYHALNQLSQQKITPRHISCFLDSELVVKQLRGEYKIKSPHLLEINQRIKQLIKAIINQGVKTINFNHIPRAQNKIADSLVNQALDHPSLNG